jgi:hypothetical protein
VAAPWADIAHSTLCYQSDMPFCKVDRGAEAAKKGRPSFLKKEAKNF